MGEFDNNLSISASYSSEEPLWSEAPEPLNYSPDPQAAPVQAENVDVCIAPEADPFFSPEPLRLDTPIHLSQPIYGRQTLPLRQLLEWAGSESREAANLAQVELANVIQTQMAQRARYAVEACFLDQDQDLTNALALLMTPEDVADFRQRRMDGAFLLADHVLANENEAFQRGLIFTLSRLGQDGNQEANLALREIERQIPRHHPLESLVRHQVRQQPEVPQEIAQQFSERRQQRAEGSPTVRSSIGGGAPLESPTEEAKAVATTGSSNHSTGDPLNLTNTIQEVIQNHADDLEGALSSQDAKALSSRALQLANHPEAAQYLAEHIRLSTLTQGVLSPFANVANFPQLQNVASDVAAAVARAIQNRTQGRPEEDPHPLQRTVQGHRPLATPESTEEEGRSVPLPLRGPTGISDATHPLIAGTTATITADPSVVNPATQSFAAMQGMRFALGAVGPQNLAQFRSGPDHDQVEAISASEDGTHSGSQEDNSQGGNSENQGQNPQHSPQPTAYV